MPPKGPTTEHTAVRLRGWVDNTFWGKKGGEGSSPRVPPLRHSLFLWFVGGGEGGGCEVVEGREEKRWREREGEGECNFFFFVVSIFI